MPRLPLTGTKRARAGLADEPLVHSALKAIHAEHAARALVSILPFGCAGFVLHGPSIKKAFAAILMIEWSIMTIC
jgi:hypothetical protein